MGKRTKNLVAASSVLTLVLIFTTAIYLAKLDTTSNDIKDSIAVGIIIILLALVSILVIYYQRRKKEKKYAILSPSYKDLLDDVMTNIATSNMSHNNKRQVEEDLLDFFVQASHDNKPLETVVGENIEQFIDEIIKAHGSTNNFLTYEIQGFQFFIIYLFLAQGFEFIENNGLSFFNTRVENSTILLFGIIAFITLPLVMHIYKTGAGKNQFFIVISAYIIIPALTLGIFIAVMESQILIRLFGNYSWAHSLMNESSVIISNFYILIGLLLLFPTSWGIRKLIQKKAMLL